MGDRYHILSQMEHLQSKYVGTGHADTGKWEWLTQQHRDTLAAYLMHNDLQSYISIAENETKARMRFNLMNRMVSPCGPPPEKSPFDQAVYFYCGDYDGGEMSVARTGHTPRVPVPGKALGRLFAKPDFDATGFCHNVLKGGHDEVDDTARAAAIEMTQAENQLHDAVYASEGLSVTASRQLRSAQADVCLLSSRLSEQRAEIGKLIAAPLFSSEASGSQAASANMRRDSDADYAAGNTSTSGGGGLLAEKVEGCGFLGDAPGRGLLFDGQLTELDPDPPNQQLRRIHMYLLTDCIVTAVVPQHHPRTVMRNRFDRLFPIDQVAVTAAPPPAPSTRLRLLSFPESRLFDTDNAGVRTAWLHQIDIAKKSRSRNRPQDPTKTPPAHGQQHQQPIPESGDVALPATGHTPEWLQEALDELDVFVAERDLESAVDSLLAIRKEWKQTTAIAEHEGFSDSQATATTNRLRQRQNELVFLLFRELDTSVTRGAFLDARLAVTLLSRIDKAAEATHRLLAHGSTILRNRTSQQSSGASGSSNVLTSLSRQLAENMANTGFSTIAEFVEVIRGALASCGFGMQAAPEPTSETSIRIVDASVLASCTAALTAWVGSQTHWLTAQVYNTSANEQQQAPNLQTLTECADILRRAINSQAVFAGVGLELWPIVELFLAPFTTAAVKQAQAVLVESIRKHLVISSSSSTGASSKQQLTPAALVSSLPPSLVAKIGAENLNKHFEACPLAPPSRVAQFADAILNFTTQLCSVYSTMQHTPLCRAVTSVLRAAAEQLVASKKTETSPKGTDDITASFKFLFGPVLDRVMLQFRKTSKLETREFVQLQKDCYAGNLPSSPPVVATPPPQAAAPAAVSSGKIASASPKQQQKSAPTHREVNVDDGHHRHRSHHAGTTSTAPSTTEQMRRPRTEHSSSAQSSSTPTAAQSHHQSKEPTGRPPTPRKATDEFV